MRKTIQAVSVTIMFLFLLGCGSTSPVTVDEPELSPVDRVLEEVGPFDLDNVDTYPEVETVLIAVEKVLELEYIRWLDAVNDPDCSPPLQVPFPVSDRGTSMTLDEQNMYFSGHITLSTFRSFGQISSNGVTGCDIYWILYDTFAALDNGTGFWFQYLVDVQETNRFGMFGPGGYDVPDEWDEDPCPLEIPCTR
jgi:hypothetical protein